MIRTCVLGRETNSARDRTGGYPASGLKFSSVSEFMHAGGLEEVDFEGLKHVLIWGKFVEDDCKAVLRGWELCAGQPVGGPAV